jgi:hypothetical protein
MKWRFLFAVLIAVMITAATAGDASAQRWRCRPHYYHRHYSYYHGPRAVVVVRPGYGYYHRPHRYYYRERVYAYGPRYYHRPYHRGYYRGW